MTRRSIGVALVLATVLSTAAAPARAGGIPPVLVRWPGGAMVISPDERSKVIVDAPDGLATPSGAAVVSTVRSGGSTTVRVVDGASGVSQWSADVAGAWRAEAISADGGSVVLGDPTSAPTIEHVPVGREMTPFTLVRSDGKTTTITLPGNFQGEAFTADGQVVLIEHLPAAAPTQYRVRLYDPKLGRIADPIGRDKRPLVSETMQGVRNGHVWTADSKALYTLYDASTPAQASMVFVHALNLRAYDVATRDPDKDRLAKCLLVPEEIDAGGGSGALAVMPDNNVVVAGRRGIAVIDATNGVVIRQRLMKFSGRLSVAVSGAEIVVGSNKTITRFSYALNPLSKFQISTEIASVSSMPYYPVLVLDATGRLWLAASYELAAGPVLRGQLPRPLTGRISMQVRTG